MREIWADARKFQIWLEIEVLASEAMAELGQIPKKDAAEIRARAQFSIPEIAEIEKRTNHDVIAFLENVASFGGPSGTLDSSRPHFVGHSGHRPLSPTNRIR